MTAAIRRHLVETRYGAMHVRTAGDGGTPLVLLHSQFIAGRIFDPAIPLLARGRTVVVPDRIGHGDSDHWPEALGYDELAAATRDALDGLGIDRFDAFGFHSGSPEVLEHAVVAPERLRRAVVAGLWDWDEQERARLKERYVKPPPQPAEDGSHLLFYWRWWMDHRPPEADLNVVQQWTLEHQKAGDGYWRTFEAAIDYPMAQKVPAVTQPLLVLMARDHADDRDEKTTALLPPQARTVELPHITNAYGLFRGHLDEITDVIGGFLDD